MADLLEVTNEAYAALLDHIADTWKNFAVFGKINNGPDGELLRLSGTDPRLTPQVTGKVMRFELHLSGRDPEINASDKRAVTVHSSGIFREPGPSSGDAMSLDEFPPFRFINPADELTIHHAVHVPGGQSMIDFKQVNYTLGPNDLWTHIAVKWPGVTSKTHAAWANAFRFEGWFFGDQRPASRKRMVEATAVIDGPDEVQLVITRPITDGDGFSNNVGVFVVEQPAP